MQKTLRAFSKKVTLWSVAFVLAFNGMAVAVPLFTTQKASAEAVSAVVYNALPSVSSPTNYPSVGYQATSTSEFGDYVHLDGTNRKLGTVTVTMSNWAKYADYASDPAYSGNTSTWSLPVTLNVYSNVVDANGVPTTELATVTQTITVPWRPASDPSCASTTNGNGWKVGDTCYNYSGIAFNAVFDLSSSNVTLPDDVIVGVAFNTQTHGYAPAGVAGPYNSLNVAVPANQSVSMGADNNASEVVVNSTWAGQYGSAGSTGVFRKDTGWGVNGTLAMQITASAPLTIAPAAPTLVTPDWYIANGATKTLTWNASSSSDVAYYEYAEYNNTAPISDTTTPSWIKTITAPTTTTTDTAWQSDIKIFWRVRAVDVAGNKSTWSETRTIVTDRTKPTSTHDLASLVHGTVSITQAISDNFASKSGKLRIWKLTNGVTDNSKFYAIGDVNVDAEGKVVYSLATLTNLFGDGQYIAKFTATDRAGNASVVEKQFTVDNTAPTVTVNPVADSTNTQPTISGTTSELGGDVTIIVDGFTQGTVASDAAGNWVWIPTTPLTVGPHTILATATDAAGNSSPTSTSTSQPYWRQFSIAAPVLRVTPPTAQAGPAPALPAPQTQVIAANDDAAVLGEQDTTVPEVKETASNDQEVAGTSDEKKAEWNLFGIAWYWLLAVLAAIALIWWMIAARRRHDTE